MTTSKFPTVAYDVPEARKRLGGISTPTLYKLIESGKLRATKIGRRTLFTDTQISECLTACAGAIDRKLA